jgi:starvation-inducible DNA-binding protein
MLQRGDVIGDREHLVVLDCEDCGDIIRTRLQSDDEIIFDWPRDFLLSVYRDRNGHPGAIDEETGRPRSYALYECTPEQTVLRSRTTRLATTHSHTTPHHIDRAHAADRSHPETRLPMTHTTRQNHHPTPRHTARDAITSELQKALVTLIDLALIGKHARWNVVGPSFRSLHRQLDEMVDAWRDAADTVGERIAALGRSPDGRAETVADDSEIPTLAEGRQPDCALVASLTGILTDAVHFTRLSVDRIEDADPVTADLLHAVVATLEEHLWIIRVQAA